MITIADSSPYSRRSFLHVGGLGLGGLTLSQLLGWKASAARSGLPIRDKSVVFLFMHGGPPQQETFDPKMDAPVEIRSSTAHRRRRHRTRRARPRPSGHLAQRIRRLRSSRWAIGSNRHSPSASRRSGLASPRPRARQTAAVPRACDASLRTRWHREKGDDGVGGVDQHRARSLSWPLLS